MSHIDNYRLIKITWLKLHQSRSEITFTFFVKRVGILRGVYKHIKTGNLYEVIAKDIINCTNGFEETTLVLYQKFNLVNKNIPNEIFARETKEFKEKFKVNTNQYGIKSCVCGYKDSVSFSINVLQKGQINIMHFTCPDCGKIGSYKRPALEEILV